jgi:hypothetical protein
VLSKFVWELYTIFNKIVKAIHIRSRAAYRLKIIARARSTDNKPLGLIHTHCNVIAKSVSLTSLTIGGVFFGENDLNFEQPQANVDPIFIKYRVVSLINELLAVF